jgi:hypothetical protein
MQLESQLQGYQMLLGGSDFARYTTAGQAKDRIVIGFPISVYPQRRHENMAAEVEITYFPPNANQFVAHRDCKQRPAANAVSDNDERFSPGDAANASAACEQQEQTLTIINILPTDRSYNVVGVAERSTQFAAAAVVGTVGLGGSAARSKETQFLVAQQDTVALQGNGSATCPMEPVAESEPHEREDTQSHADWSETVPGELRGEEHCVPGSRGVRFKWQFRPVLGESFVRPGRRVTFVQLAIPNVRRPYPGYGGIVYIRTLWVPFDSKRGVIEDDPLQSRSKSVASPAHYTVANVFGHTFISSEVSKIAVSDLGSGSLLVSLDGTYLTGATVRIGGSMLTSSTPGFLSEYNSVHFVTTAQALAQGGSYLISAEGVESRIDLSSVCKSWDDDSECALDEPDPNRRKLTIAGISVLPVSETSSLVKVTLDRLSLLPQQYSYYHYQRDEGGNVIGNLQQRKPDLSKPFPMNITNLRHTLQQWPLVLNVGGRIYGFSDAPFQSIKTESGGVTLAAVVSNDSINVSPQVRVQRLFGNPQDDSDWQSFVPPGRITVSLDPRWIAERAAKERAGSIGPCRAGVTCHYVIAGASVEDMSVEDVPTGCGKVILASSNSIQRNARGLAIPGCARQLSLRYPVSSLSGAAMEDDSRRIEGHITVMLTGPTTSTPDAAKDAIPVPGTVSPHFQLTRTVKQAYVSDGVAYLTVNVQSLKDQTATVSVQNADVIRAEDGNGTLLPLQPGNSVIVLQDTPITFQIRNYGLQGVGVQAEGKNAGVSTGKLKFDPPFAIVTRSNPTPGGRRAN